MIYPGGTGFLQPPEMRRQVRVLIYLQTYIELRSAKAEDARFGIRFSYRARMTMLFIF